MISSSRNAVIINQPGLLGIESWTIDSSEFVTLLQSLHEDAKLSYGGMVFGFPQFFIVAPLFGGKGGFGSLLRSQKNIGKKTDNFDSARDQSGRRIRVAKKDERLEEWKAKKDAEDRLVESLKADKIVAAPISLDKKYIDTLSKSRSLNESALREGLNVVVVSKKPTRKLKDLDF